MRKIKPIVTQRQKNVARDIVMNARRAKPLTGKEIILKSGYSNPQNVTHVINSQGVKVALKEYGFDSGTAKTVVGNILTESKNESNKLKAAEMVFKVEGDFAPEKHINVNIEERMPTEEIQEIARRMLDMQKYDTAH